MHLGCDCHDVFQLILGRIFNAFELPRMSVRPQGRLRLFARLVVSGVAIEAVIATFRFRHPREL
jgi:hypothetical protein